MHLRKAMCWGWGHAIRGAGAWGVGTHQKRPMYCRSSRMSTLQKRYSKLMLGSITENSTASQSDLSLPCGIDQKSVAQQEGAISQRAVREINARGATHTVPYPLDRRLGEQVGFDGGKLHALLVGSTLLLPTTAGAHAGENTAPSVKSTWVGVQGLSVRARGLVPRHQYWLTTSVEPTNSPA